MLIHPAPRTARHRPRARLHALLAVGLGVLVVHGMLLGARPGASEPAPPALPTMTVRTLDAPANNAIAPPRAVATLAPIRAPGGRADRPVSPPPAPTQEAVRPADIDVPQPMVKASAAVGTPETSPSAPADAIPVYRTRLPAARTLRYELRRGMLSGHGDLFWKPAGDGYEARLEGHVAGLHVLTENSAGRIDAHGLAPVRYTDSRMRRGTSAANFQHETGVISYSGPQTRYPLLPGTQDRLSWMVQIGAVLNAEPQHAAPGGRITFFVSGAHGDADAWTFRYVGAETLSGPHGTVHAVRFTREPRKTYDKRVDVWLAPEHEHLPVQARFTATANGDVFELLLRRMDTP